MLQSLSQSLTRPLTAPLTAAVGSGSFALTVAAWYDAGAPGRFVPTYKDWQTSGALWLDSSTRITALEQAVWMNLDRSRNLARSAELITNGDFSSATGWAVTGAGVAITGGQGVFTAAATGAGFSQGVAVAGRTYEVVYTVVSISAGAVRAYAGSGGTGTNRTVPGTYTELIVASGTNLASITAIGTTTAVVDNVSFKEIPGAHRIQPTSQSRSILTARKNRFDNSAWLNSGALPTGWTMPGGSGTSIPNGTIDGNTIYRQTAVAQRPFLQPPIVTMVVGQVLTNSLRVHSIYSGATTIGQLVNFVAGTGNGSSAYSLNGAPALTSDALPPDCVVAITFTCTVAGTLQPRTGLGVGTLATCDLDVSRPMLTLGGADQVGRYQRTGLTATVPADYDAAGFPVGLRRDGIDDRDATAGNVDFSAANRIGYAWAGRKESTGRSTAMILSPGNNVTAGSVGLETTFATSGTYRCAMNPAGAANVPYALISGYPEPSANVVSCLNDRTTTVIANAIQARVDGALRPGQTAYASEANLSTAAFINAQISFGANGGSGGQYLAGVEYGDFWLGDCTLDQLAVVEKGFAPLLSEALA